MIWDRKKQPPDHFVNFHHHEQRISAIEAATRKTNIALLAVFRSIGSDSLAVKRLCEAIEEALKVPE